jgi:hypothetical protein
LSFGSQTVGTSSGAQSVTLSNRGGSALAISAITLAGAQRGDYQIATNCGSSLAAAASCSVSLTFTPAAIGARSATLNFADNAAAAPQIVSITGTAMAVPTASLSPTSLSFASQTVGTSSGAQYVTLSNSGGSALAISAITLAGAQPGDYQIATNCGSSLAAAASCSVSVTFTPAAIGARSATLNFADNAVGAPQIVSITGTALAVPTASLSPASLSFASQTVGTSSGAQSVTLSNSGDGATDLPAIAPGVGFKAKPILVAQLGAGK